MAPQDFLFYAAAFLFALAILIAVHEFGHFWVAKKLGVQVLRFSIGFGRPLVRWIGRKDGTEYVIAGIPLGGYVKMLDEREGEVPPERLHAAFNRQPLWRRTAIVAAGPVFNFIFAIVAFWVIFVTGEIGTRSIVGEVVPESIAARSGFQQGDELLRIRDRQTPTWEAAIYALLAESLEGETVSVLVRDAGGIELYRDIDGTSAAELADNTDLFNHLGLKPASPTIAPVIGELVSGEAAEAAGVRAGDRILAVDGEPVDSWRQLVGLVRGSPGTELHLQLERAGGEYLELSLTPRLVQDGESEIGRIGAGPDVPDTLYDDYQAEVRYGPIESIGLAVAKTGDLSALMLRMIGRMLTGQVSLKNLGGPIAIAETAGKTASYGFESFLKFLAFVSVSLGVLNLLPIPVLDGGHLLYFFIEWVKGSPLPEQAQAQGQKIGLFLLAALMSLTFYIDISRLLG